jgi:hypothetical protein
VLSSTVSAASTAMPLRKFRRCHMMPPVLPIGISPVGRDATSMSRLTPVFALAVATLAASAAVAEHRERRSPGTRGVSLRRRTDRRVISTAYMVRVGVRFANSKHVQTSLLSRAARRPPTLRLRAS